MDSSEWYLLSFLLTLFKKCSKEIDPSQHMQNDTLNKNLMSVFAQMAYFDGFGPKYFLFFGGGHFFHVFGLLLSYSLTV